MAVWARIRSLMGGDRVSTTYASASAFSIPDSTNLVYLTGTTTIATITVGNHTRNRRITIVGASGCSVTFTNNNTPTSAGQMNLRGSDRLLLEDYVLELLVKADGTIVLVNLT